MTKPPPGTVGVSVYLDTISRMTNAALELAEVFNFWWSQGQQTGSKLVELTSKSLEVPQPKLFSHLAKLLTGVESQIQDLESVQQVTTHYRKTEEKWSNAVFMKATGWTQGPRNPVNIIDQPSIAVLESLGHTHNLARKDGQAPSALFISLLADLRPILSSLNDLDVPPPLKILLAQKTEALSRLLSSPSISYEVVLTQLTGLIGVLTFLIMKTEEDKKAEPFRSKAKAWVNAVVFETTVNLSSSAVLTAAVYAPNLIGG